MMRFSSKRIVKVVGFEKDLHPYLDNYEILIKVRIAGIGTKIFEKMVRHNPISMTSNANTFTYQYIGTTKVVKPFLFFWKRLVENKKLYTRTFAFGWSEKQSKLLVNEL